MKIGFRTLGLLTASAVLMTGACSSPSPGASPGGSASFGAEPSGNLKTSGFNPSDEVGASRADFAKKALPNVTVTMDTTNFDSQKFAAQAASGQTPDLIQVDRSIVATLADKKLIIPLDDCYAAHNVVPDKQYYPSTVKDVTFDGKVYGVPQFFQATALLANKRVLKQAGIDGASLDTSKPDLVLQAAKALSKESGGTPTVLGFDPDMPGSANIWFRAFGGSVFADDGAPTLDSAENVKALTWLKDLMDAQGGYAKIKSFKDSMDVFGDGNQYVKDQVGVQTWAQWYPNVLAATASKVSLEAIPIRTLKGDPLAMAGGSAFAIPTGGANPTAACAWALSATSTDAWLAAGEAREATVKKNGSIMTGLMTGSPVADKAVRDKFVKPSGNADFDQVIATYYDVLDHNEGLGSSAVGQQAKQELDNAVIVALTGEKDPKQALTDAQAAAQRAWDQR